MHKYSHEAHATNVWYRCEVSIVEKSLLVNCAYHSIQDLLIDHNIPQRTSDKILYMFQSTCHNRSNLHWSTYKLLGITALSHEMEKFWLVKMLIKLVPFDKTFGKNMLGPGKTLPYLYSIAQGRLVIL